MFSTVEGVQYCGGYLEYHEGCSVPWPGYHDKRGRYLEHREVFIAMGDIMTTVGGYFAYSGGCSVQWEDMIHVWGIMSTVGNVQYCGDTQITKDDIPLGTEHPAVLKRSPHIYHDIPHSTPPSWY